MVKRTAEEEERQALALRKETKQTVKIDREHRLKREAEEEERQKEMRRLAEEHAKERQRQGYEDGVLSELKQEDELVAARRAKQAETLRLTKEQSLQRSLAESESKAVWEKRALERMEYQRQREAREKALSREAWGKVKMQWEAEEEEFRKGKQKRYNAFGHSTWCSTTGNGTRGTTADFTS